MATERIQLKPQYLTSTEPSIWKALSNEGVEAYQRELKRCQEESEKKRRARYEYLLEIDRIQNVRDLLPWPYDLCKMSGDSQEVLQWARKHDHLFDYKRENPCYEYDPKNYEHLFQEIEEEQYYEPAFIPDYENFKDFEFDQGNDVTIDEFYQIN